MNTEKMIAKGVEKHFDGQKVLFKVKSLKEHYGGLLIHDSDILLIEEEAYVRVGDVGFEGATTNEIHPKSEEVSELTIDIEVAEERIYDKESITTISSTTIPERIVKAEYQEKTPYEEIEVIESEVIVDETPEE